MGVKTTLILIVLTMLLTTAVNLVYSELNTPQIQKREILQANEVSFSQEKEIINNILEVEKEVLNKNKPSPSDWIKEEQIKVYKDKVIIEIENAQWARFTDTKSMDPVLDSTANAIQIIPENESQIKVGDIISFETQYTKGTIIHRVIEKGQDNKGTYFITKGDNNINSDPGKLRFEQIRRVLIAIIY